MLINSHGIHGKQAFYFVIVFIFTVIKFNLVVDKYFDNIINVILVFPFSPDVFTRV